MSYSRSVDVSVERDNCSQENGVEDVTKQDDEREEKKKWHVDRYDENG